MKNITTLITTVWIPSCPDTHIIEEVIASVKKQLPHCPIKILCDGLRAELEEHREDYAQYLSNLYDVYAKDKLVSIQIFDEHHHQADMTRVALETVTTPLILFVEHDTPLVGDIPWKDMSDVIQIGYLNVVRLSHDTSLYTKDGHLALHMNHPEPVMIGKLPVVRTVQWSQRPHLASTEFYRWMMDTYFAPGCNTFIELVMHGVVANAYFEHGEEGWQRFKVGLYNTEGNIQRSTHLNGNEGGPKFMKMRFKYPNGITPEGAPNQVED